MQVETRHYDFKNDVKKCENVCGESELDKCIASILRKEGYISCDVTKKIIPADGGNYLAQLCEIDVKGKTTDGETETALFVKTMTATPEAMDLISITDVYQNELFFYTELSHIFTELQNSANIPKNEKYNTVKCYEESNDTTLIMENLARKGFRTRHRMDTVSLSMAEECMKQLARLHGLSFVLEEKRPEYFNRRIKHRPFPQQFGKVYNDFVEKLTKTSMELLDGDIRKKMEAKIPATSKKMEEYVSDVSNKYCLCHGDYRANNIMVKEKDGIVTEVVPIDYQFVYHGCPVIDLIYFIYMGTDRRFRKTHMNHLKNLYYKSLDEFLRYFDMSVESVFPRKLFENLYEEKLDFGLMIAFVILQFVFVSENDDPPDFTKQSAAELEVKLDDRYKDRLIGVVEEMMELGYV